MVGFSTVGFALSVVIVLEFDSACWAVCDAHGLCSCEYLFSELFVFACACSAHRVSSSLLCGCLLVLFACVVLGGGASQRQRDERLHRLTLLSVHLSFFLSFSFFFFLSFLWKGVCCVVRAQPCEHARDTTHALCSGFVYCGWLVLFLPQHSVCCSHHTLFIVNDHHAHH